MTDLIPRLERATGPDRELDAEIAEARGIPVLRPQYETEDRSMCKLTKFEVELLRDLNGEDRGLCWGAAMSEALGPLSRQGLLVKRVSIDGAIHYKLSDKGRRIAEKHRDT